MAGWDHAIEKVDTARHHADQVLWTSDPHDVPGPVGGKQRGHHLDGSRHLSGRLPHRHAPNRVTGKVQGGDLRCRTAPEIVVNTALDNPEEGLIVPTVSLGATLCPAGGAIDGPLDRWPIRGVGSAFVKGHDDVRAE